MPYVAPVPNLLFLMQHVADLNAIAQWPGLEDAGLDTAQAVLEECAKLNESVIAPLNKIGDMQPPVFDQGKVTTSPGFADAYAQFSQGGWQGLQHPTAYGGQGLPKMISAACAEILNSANLSFALCPLLTDGAIEALLTAGSAALKERYLSKLVSGEWTGTMNLTEPQAGSDLAMVRTRAELQPGAAGTYRLFGTKIYITYGEHDMSSNIVHLVLARIPGAPEGVKGLSLFVCPKYLVEEGGTLGARNDVHCISIEHKLGIKASPTAVLQYGDGITKPEGKAGAVAFLVGEANRGLEYMFIMMNAARFAVGIQGVAIAERAYQKALHYAQERVQCRPVDGSASEGVPIIHHPDVRRMLMYMRSATQGCRAMAMAAAAAHDAAHHHPDATVRQDQAARYEFLVPLVKGYSTELAVEVASLGVQVHGGMGFIEETGAAQYYRDARILTIYEGTTAIQANDLLSRKTVRDAGKAAHALALEIGQTQAMLMASATPQATVVAQHLQSARMSFEQVVDWLVAHTKAQPNAAYAGAVSYLMLAGGLVAGWQLARLLLAAQSHSEGTNNRWQQHIDNAYFFADHVLSHAPVLAQRIVQGHESILASDLTV